jgi:hypothetical protein
MTRLTIFLFLFFATVISACDSLTTHQGKLYIPADTTTSFRINNYWATPKKSFNYNSLRKSSEETLHLVTCSDYVYFPFGKLTDKSSLKTSLLNIFTITECKRDTFTNIMLPSDPADDIKQWTESLKLELGANKLTLFLDNDQEASMHGYIRSGQIMDKKVLFSENIRIGMSSADFYKCFFDYFPPELNLKYKIVELESCVTDVTHIYTFDNGQLSSVKFIND